MQFQQLHQHQIEVHSLDSGNLSSVQPTFRHLIDFVTVQHQVGCESVVLIKKDVRIKSLQKSGAQITNIVVTDNNIKSFDRVARKYGIDYSLKKVEQEGKSEYLVFFKAKDVDIMTAAFKEYTNETMKKQKRESVRQKLEKVKEELSNHRQLKKEKKREQEPIR